VVGLGNPGPEYEGTRHNIGFDVADLLARECGAEFRKERRWSAWVARAGDLLLVKPTTYMNLSGEAVSAVARFHRIAPAETLVVLDDIALPLGRLRLRPDGSAGGHNGLRSVLAHLGTQAVPRLRVGIGAATGPAPLTDHVLGRFTAAERPLAEAAAKRATEAVGCIRERGLAAAMNLFNANHPTQPSNPIP